MRSLLPISLMLLLGAGIVLVVNGFDPPRWFWIALPVLLLVIFGATVDQVRANRWMARQSDEATREGEDR